MNAITTNNQTGQQIKSEAHQTASINDVLKTLPTLNHFIGRAQLQVMGDGCRGEEREYFKAKFVELFELVNDMPKTYEQDGMGDDAVAHLHYFARDCDWFITELDMELLDQRQAFGLACIWEEEIGYVSIQEILAAGGELDLHFKPQTLREIKSRREVEQALSDPNSVMATCHY